MEVDRNVSFKVRGIVPAMVTPIGKDGEVNLPAMRKLTNYLIDAGVHGLFAVGGQGEFWALSAQEKKAIIETVVDETNGRVPVYAGTGATTTAEAIKLTKIAEVAGADAVSIITPYYVAPSQDEMLEHYKAIAKSTKLPVVLYNNPPRTGCNISPAMIEKAAKVENIVGVKDSGGDMTQAGEYIRRTSSDFAVLMGRDTLIFGGMCIGAKGSITATANVAPKLVVEIYEAFMAGDMVRAQKCQDMLAPLRLAFELATFPVVIKEALEMIGIEAGPARLPVGPMKADKRKELYDVLITMGLPAKL
jgi:4-hydroxy-tetrahydrodipicolinate synthase